MLRYPGGKSRLKKHILPHIRALLGGLNYAEVMVGGGSIAVAIGEEFPEKQIMLNDIDPDVSNFWKVASGQLGVRRVEELRQVIAASRAPSDDRVNGFEYWKSIRDSKPTDPVARAFRFVLLNKTTFGGQVDASPVGGLDQTGWQGSNGRAVFCQYNVDNVIQELDRVYSALRGRTKVYCLDVMTLLSTLDASYLPYIDPPYFPGKDNKLYRAQMPLESHEALAAFLERWKHPWVLSYDDHPDVRQLYHWADLVMIPTHYSHGPGPSEKEREDGKRKQWKKGFEILVLPKGMTTTTTETTTTASAVSAATPVVKKHRRTKAEVAAARAAELAAAAPLPAAHASIVLRPSYPAYAAFIGCGDLLIDTISPTESLCRQKCQPTAEVCRVTITKIS